MFDRIFYCLDVQAPLDTATLFIDLLVVLQVRWQQLHLVLISLCGDHLLMGRLSGPLELECTGLFFHIGIMAYGLVAWAF